MSYITGIGTATPANKFKQSTIGGFMERTMHLDSGQKRKLAAVFKSSGIDYRFSVLEDYGRENNFSFYPEDSLSPAPGTAERMKLFREHALPLSVAAVNDLASGVKELSLNDITHLIVVTCTGMYAPGLDIDIIKALGLPGSIHRTCITFMGCYAAFNAFKCAHAFCTSDPKAKVLIVCTELCSIHFQQSGTDDNLLANALFADGSAAVLVEAQAPGKKRLKMQAFHNELAFNGERDMAWGVGDTGFEMRLSAYIPKIVEAEICKLTDRLMDKLKKKREDIRFFAIHPGGKKILEAIESQLALSREDNVEAYDVLKNYGNMSSPTVVFVLKRLFEKFTPADNGAFILCAAFGPGLTLEGMLAQVETD